MLAISSMCREVLLLTLHLSHACPVRELPAIFFFGLPLTHPSVPPLPTTACDGYLQLHRRRAYLMASSVRQKRLLS